MKILQVFFVCLFAPAFLAVANEPFIPSSPDFVIATWQVDKKVDISLPKVARLISDAKYPGNSGNFALAQKLLQKHEVNLLKRTQTQPLVDKAELIYLQAVIAQYYHEFQTSLDLLASVLTLQPRHANAILLQSNMYLLLGEYAKAQQACSRLLGLAQQSIIAACASLAKSQTGDIEQSLNSLMRFVSTQDALSDEVSIWLAEIQASLAKDAGKLTLAESLLRPYKTGLAPVSYWVLWADIKTALNAHQEVLTTLGKIVSETENKDDALLLRLAIAEKQVQSQKQIPNEKWVSQAAARVALREQRQDHEHAFDIALYYLYIQIDAVKAHKWATINWQQAKLIEDAELLRLSEDALSAAAVKQDINSLANTVKGNTVKGDKL